jgi:hypothetical protein
MTFVQEQVECGEGLSFGFSRWRLFIRMARGHRLSRRFGVLGCWSAMWRTILKLNVGSVHSAEL